MHHLKPEELARLVDEPAGAEEAAHLAKCGRCSSELEELKLQTGLLGELADPVMPDVLRRRIGRALETAPLGRGAGGSGAEWVAAWPRVAAGILIFVFGGATGTFVVAPRMAPDTEVAVAIPVLDPAAEAAASLAAAEAEYLQALARFARINFANDGLDPLNRLAALEGIVLTTRSALREAPADPVINGYHLTALGQRDELLRQLEEADPVSEWF